MEKTLDKEESPILNTEKALDRDMCSNLSEFTLNSILDDGIFKDIPLMGTFWGAIETYKIKQFVVNIYKIFEKIKELALSLWSLCSKWQKAC